MRVPAGCWYRAWGAPPSLLLLLLLLLSDRVKHSSSESQQRRAWGPLLVVFASVGALGK